MMGRVDTKLVECPECGDRTGRRCKKCKGSGRVWCCTTCNNYMPCPGTVASMFDQSHCDAELAAEYNKHEVSK